MCSQTGACIRCLVKKKLESMEMFWKHGSGDSEGEREESLGHEKAARTRGKYSMLVWCWFGPLFETNGSESDERYPAKCLQIRNLVEINLYRSLIN